MKKMLALLLVLMLPMTAVADAFRTEATLHVNEANLVEWFTPRLDEIIPADSGIKVDKLLSAIARIGNGLGLRATIQPDACAMDLLMNGKPLFDMAMQGDVNRYLVTSTLFPEHMLVWDAEDITGGELLSFSQPDFSGVSFHLRRELKNWFRSLEYTVVLPEPDESANWTTARCWTIYESDVANLVDALMTDSMRDSLKLALGNMTFVDMIWSYLVSANERARTDSAYCYELTLYEDADGELCSMTFFIMEDEKLLLYAGADWVMNAIGLDIGYGMDRQNHFITATLTLTEIADGLRIYGLVETGLSTAGEASGPEKTTSATEVKIDLTHADHILAWDYLLDTVYPQDKPVILPTHQTVTGSGSLNYAEQTADMKASCAFDEKELFSWEFSHVPCDPLPPIRKTALIPCNPMDQDVAMQELYYEVMDKMQVNLTVRMMKLFPLDVMMTIPNLLTFE